jgi:hypothetical protein
MAERNPPTNSDCERHWSGSEQANPPGVTDIWTEAELKGDGT